MKIEQWGLLCLERTLFRTFIIIIFLSLLPSLAFAEIISKDTVWQGQVTLEDDTLILAGAKLTVLPGTRIVISPADNTKIDPEYLSHQTEILVRGVLEVKGTIDNPVYFEAADLGPETEWAGIVVDGGQVSLNNCSLRDAEVGGYVIRGAIVTHNAKFTGNHYALIAQGSDSSLKLNDSQVFENDYGLLIFDGAKVVKNTSQIQKNDKSNEYIGISRQVRVAPKEYVEKERPLTRIYKNETLLGDNVWSGKIRIEGQVRLSLEARLVILPGTVVEFTKNDTNGDGIGENGILVQGFFMAKGTREEPIIFRSAEKNRRKGDWDSINILGSDQTRNLIEFCQVEDAYRGMHFHFANVAVTNSVMRNNFRGIQFQESLVEIRNSQFYGNNSAIQARDSQVIFNNNQIFANINGANLFRMNLKAAGNLFVNNMWDGLRIREGATNIEGNTMAGNRFGLLVADAVFGRFDGNLLAGNLEGGLALKNSDHIECDNNAITANGINGVIIRDSRALLRGNLISDNGERGIGVLSFSGVISGNNFSGNGLYDIGLDGPGDVDAADNWWADADLAKKIYDASDDQSLGVVHLGEIKKEPHLFNWPVSNVPVDLSWTGLVGIKGVVEVVEGSTLTVKPGTVIRFKDSESGLQTFGTIKAIGTDDQRILFTSAAGKGVGDWGEIYLERAVDSIFVNCDFENAGWAIHCHLVNLVVDRCRFRNNDGGLRFRGGPVRVSKSNFTENRIAIRSFLGFGVIEKNNIVNNEIGIFVREKGSGLKVVGNNLSDNERYNMRLGDFNNEDVDAKNNWWGTDDVVETVFDKNRESYIGLVLFEPVLKKPISPVLEAWQ